MSKNWKKIFNDTVDGRDVVGEEYFEGGYKVTTTTKTEDSGLIEVNDSQYLSIPPTAVGTKIPIEDDTLEELEKRLVNEGEFSDKQATEICNKFKCITT